MERSSQFVTNKALFGSYPSQENVNLFESMGVRYFVDLTCKGEKRITPYTTKYKYLYYPIQDRRVPTNWRSFARFIIKLVDIINNLPDGQMMYVHCKGGHGRSGIVVACLLCYLHNINPSEALTKTTNYHNCREEMKEKWRKLGSPQTRSQKHFVTKFFEPLYIYNNYTNYFSSGFNNDASISVMIPEFGLFPTATSAYNALKDPSNAEYVGRLEVETNISKIHNICELSDIRSDWEYIKESAMYMVLKNKFNQNVIIKNNLLDTGLRTMIVHSTDNLGNIMLGKLITKLRKEFYINNII
jgi:predicted NAD-dependent protein-ADP-ribosyltransferase YbiA (DUF1768 family)